MTFLENLAEIIIARYPNPRELVIVFPNRRAGMFLRKILKAKTEGPMWSPDIISFLDLISRESTLKLADPVLLIHKLYQVYKKHLPIAGEEGFERFYYWGKMLLQDFDEIDKYLVNGKVLYRNLQDQKKIDLMFDFLTPDQKNILTEFWEVFATNKKEKKERFLETWQKLGDIYTDYRENLEIDGLAYEGMLYRDLAEKIEEHEWQYPRKHVLFAGFNALTVAEERIMAWCMQNGDTRIEWDIDAYYYKNKSQEAGRFFREYSSRPYFERTFPEVVPDRLLGKNKKIEIHGVPQNVGQARYMGQQLQKLLEENPEIERHKIAIVLGDESLLLPVLHSLPKLIGGINVTMGFPLSYAPVNSLIEYLAELQIKYRRDRGFYYSPVLGILRHPLIAVRIPSARSLIKETERKSKIYLDKADLGNSRLEQLIFVASDDFLEYVILILKFLEQEGDMDELNKTFIHHYRRHFTRYNDIIRQEEERLINVHSFRRLFRQLANTEKVPFTGEPLRGVQIMGVLETRNLDFEHIFVLSCNEGSFPSGSGQHSYIPYNIRRAYELPHFDQQDAMYAYLFYRLIQGVKTALFTWDTEGNEFGEEEMSRFLKQLIYEYPGNVQKTVLANTTGGDANEPITMARDEWVKDRLAEYTDAAHGKGISPSAINTYLECRLRFYFLHIARLRESEEVEEDLDARTLGNVLHYMMEFIYDDHRKSYGKEVTAEHILVYRKRREEFLRKAFAENFNLAEGEEFAVEGKNRIAWEIIMSFADKILDKDEAYAPFEIAGLEEEFDVWFELEDSRKVLLHGKVDRVDRKDDTIRIIDYKTGKDVQFFKSVEGLFIRGNNQNKVAFQTLLYTLLYKMNTPQEHPVTPHVFNRVALFSAEDTRFTYGENKATLVNVNPLQEEFTTHLKELLEELFYSDQPFDQTSDVQKCKYCEFNVICQRFKE